MTNSNGGNGVDRRRLLKGGAATAGAAYVAPQIVRTAVAGAQTITTCYVYGVDGTGCSGDVASLDGLDPSIAGQLIGAAPLGSLDRNPCTADPAGLVGTSLNTGEVVITVDANCEIVAVAAADEDGNTMVGIANTTSGGYDVTTIGFIGGIQRRSFRDITVLSGGETISSVAVTVCCTGSPVGP